MGKLQPEPMDREKFRQNVIEGGETCVVCFMAQWSEPSREIEEPVAEVTHKWYGEVPFYIVDPDEEPFIMADYSVNAVPTLIFFRDGAAVDRIVGIRNAGQIDKFVKDTYES